MTDNIDLIEDEPMSRKSCKYNPSFLPSSLSYLSSFLKNHLVDVGSRNIQKVNVCSKEIILTD